MKQGERGDSVATIQLALCDLGFAMAVTTCQGTRLPDGIFGPETAATVRDFQRMHGLEVDGIVGRQTLSKLEELIVAQIATEKVKQTMVEQLPPGAADTHHRTMRR